MWGFRYSSPFDDISTPHIGFLISEPSSFAEFESARTAVNRNMLVEANWDGYGAFPVSDEAKKNALRALDGLERSAPAPFVISNPNGTFAFEWENDYGIGHLEIGRTRFSFYIRPTVGVPVLVDGVGTQILGIGPLVTKFLYPKPSEPAYTHVFPTANV